MRTNIVIDEKLIKQGMKYTGIRTKKGVVDFALRELIKKRERKKILLLKGKLPWEGNLEEMRKSRLDDID
jgi:Arc/MetJ family transcription regulator